MHTFVCKHQWAITRHRVGRGPDHQSAHLGHVSAVVSAAAAPADAIRMDSDHDARASKPARLLGTVLGVS